MRFSPAAPLAVALLAALTAPPTVAAQAAGLNASPSKPWALHWRYRHEAVSDAAFDRDASADTLLLRATWAQRFSPQWSGLIEAEAVAELGERFNSGANRQTRFPSVPDARALEINQAWAEWHSRDLSVRTGRQWVVLDNSRFVANSTWRLNTQSFDAVQARWAPTAEIEVQALYLDRVHRSAGDRAINPLARERRLHAPLARIAYRLPNGSLVAYGYWIEDEDVAQSSTRSLGLRWDAQWPLGDGWAAGLTLERAQQTAWADAIGGSTAYALVEPRLVKGPLQLRAGWERLGAGHGRAFQTPLGSLHAFNGWADQFSTTPINGLEDRWLSVQTTAPLFGKSTQWLLRAHDFRSDTGIDYGREWNASLSMGLAPGWSGMLKYADYRTEGFGRDVRKIWFQLEWAL